MSTDRATVFVIDDDPALRDSLGWLFASVKLAVETFASPREFLDAYRERRPGCLVVDVRMPEMSGLDLQKALKSRDISLPLIFITGHGNVPMAVSAMKDVAVDFVQKPFNDQVLLDLVQRTVDRDLAQARQRAARDDVRRRLEALTPRERQVLRKIVAGEPNKSIATQFGLSEKTIEFHRANVMEKMRSKSLADLVKAVVTANPTWGQP